VLRQRISHGVRAGVVAAGATCGALVGLGVREGAPGRALALAGQRLRGVPDFIVPDPGLGAMALLGAAHHTLLLIAWALLFSVLADGLRGLRLLGVAALFAAAVWLVNAHALPPLLRFGDGAGAYPPHQWLVYSVLALSLAFGIRVGPIEPPVARRAD
jgi:hypothetical protein